MTAGLKALLWIIEKVDFKGDLCALLFILKGQKNIPSISSPSLQL